MEKAFCCAPDFPVVQTNYGPVWGYRFREISSFKGTSIWLADVELEPYQALLVRR